MDYPEFPGAAYDAWKTSEPAMPSAGDICTPEQDRHAYSLLVDLKNYRGRYGKQALQELLDEALGEVPKCLVEEKLFRIVEDVVDGNEIHCLEVRDGCDALGVERWKTFTTRGSANLQSIFEFLVVLAKERYAREQK